ncbi:PEP/pyruvate-binding domain-containing protein [Streptomyces sp. NPDC127098]|uniref:PEP/pyruvate-binding domain-containing protein n=1 Tax=Streptomyces sp. NPDC127098 TaxID=3347137 RepID=UPI003663B037
MDIRDIEINGEEPRTIQAETTLSLDDPRACRAALTGGKAAALARATRARLPVLPGFVVLPPGAGGGHGGRDLWPAWRELSGDGSRPLVVRSSSAAEDTEQSSMAGRFTSVLDVRGWAAFRDALGVVRESSAESPAHEMAVLVQPMVRSRIGGVLFGVDPVAGRTDRMLLSAVRGGPDRLVSGELPGSDLRLTRRGRPVRDDREAADPTLLTGGELRRLTALAARARSVLGGAQDIEFGFDELTGRLWLFQSRPVTALASRPRPPRRARLLGPGPVAETLPGPLLPLEEDLWVTPMAHGLATALHLAGAAGRRRLRTTPAVTTVGGQAVADLRLLGVEPPGHRLLALLDPLPGARRLAAAWRVGRLRAALPRLATALCAEVDRALSEVAPPARFSTAELLAALRWSRSSLVALHAQESLAGALLPPGQAAGTAAAAALAALRAGRAAGLPDDELAATHPEALALTTPGLTHPLRLPTEPPPDEAGHVPLSPRESLRLRVRWVQEFQIRLVHEAAARIQPAAPAAPAAPEEPRTTSPAARDSRHAEATALPAPAAAQAGPTVPAFTEGRQAEPPSSRPGRPAAPPAPTAPNAPHTSRPTPPDPRATPPTPGRQAEPLGSRSAEATALPAPTAPHAAHAGGSVGLLRWGELVRVLEGGAGPADWCERSGPPAGVPVPDRFRVADGGVVVAEGDRRTGRGVSGGRVAGVAWDGAPGSRPADAVLVVRHLDPSLAPLLPSLTGLVAQTGSPLSHLAVLARELGLATVTGEADAVRRFPPGTPLLVDGSTGEVAELGGRP